MTYTPGTTFLAFTKDNSKNYALLVLSDGKFLEVKNPDTGRKTPFDTLELWKASHLDCTFKTQVSKIVTIPISDVVDGFNYPSEMHPYNGWVRWCYGMVKEAAPHLLDSEEFKRNYNKMVEVCDKHKQELHCDYYSYDENRRYCHRNINLVDIDINPWNGFPAMFPMEINMDKTGYSKQEYETARKEIIEAYKAVLDIIKPNIENYMTEKRKDNQVGYNIIPK